MTNATLKEKIERAEGDKTCGTCRLWGMNFYPDAASGRRWNKTCCADAAMDLPASFIPARQTMEAHEGEGCIAWESLTALKETDHV